MASFLGPVAEGNYTVGRQGHTLDFVGPADPVFIVVHTMNGTIASTDTRFKNPASQESAHYGVGLGGEVVQWVLEADTAYHSGDWNTNLVSIGIQHEDGGNADGPRSDALYSASSALVRDLCLRYGIPISRRWVIKHSEVIGVASTCPGALDIDRIVAMASSAQPEEPPPQPPPHVESDAQQAAPAVAEQPATAAFAAPMPSSGGSEDLAAAQAAASSHASAPPDGQPPSDAAPAPPPAPAPAGPQLSGDPIRDIATAIYGDPGRRLDVYQSIRSVVEDLPVVRQLGRLAALVPANASLAGPIAASAAPTAAQAAPTVAPAAPVPTPLLPLPPEKLWGGSQGAVFALQIIYLILLGSLAAIYFLNRGLLGLPSTLGPLPVAIPWFGALGAVLISLVGITEHRHDWDPAYRFWHWSRPLLGASFGTISVLIFEAGILAVGTPPSSGTANVPKDLLYYLIAFVVGYREGTFRELIKRLTDVIFSPGAAGGTVTVTSMSPQTGPAQGNTPVTVVGTGLGSTDTVRFGTAQAKFHIDGDGQLTVTSPAGQAGMTVNVTVAAQPASAIAGSFTYT